MKSTNVSHGRTKISVGLNVLTHDKMAFSTFVQQLRSVFKLPSLGSLLLGIHDLCEYKNVHWASSGQSYSVSGQKVDAPLIQRALFDCTSISLYQKRWQLPSQVVALASANIEISLTICMAVRSQKASLHYSMSNALKELLNQVQVFLRTPCADCFLRMERKLKTSSVKNAIKRLRLWKLLSGKKVSASIQGDFQKQRPNSLLHFEYLSE